MSKQNEILDEGLSRVPRKSRPTGYYKWSNIAASVVILGALFRIMHWPYAALLLFFGITAHIGIELGFLLVLKGKSQRNIRRLFVTPVLFILLISWDISPINATGIGQWGFLLLCIVVFMVATYVLAKRRMDSSEGF